MSGVQVSNVKKTKQKRLVPVVVASRKENK
jgi:hypothetical protein